MLYNDYEKTDYFYKCNTCGKLFSSEYKQNILSKLFKKVKCPHCGSRDVKLTNIDRLMKKD